MNRLADEFDARTHELQDATRAYMASLEAPAKAWLSLLTERLRQWMHKIHQLARRQKGRAPAN